MAGIPTSPFEDYFDKPMESEQPMTGFVTPTAAPVGQQHGHQNVAHPDQIPRTSPFQGMDNISLMTNPMAEAGLNAGKQYAQSFIARYTASLRYYFDVTHYYVLQKTKLILAPFLEKDEWKDVYNQSNEPASPRFNKHSVDLYVPTMSFITYLLLAAFAVGTQGEFSPELIGFYCTRGILLMFLETIVMLAGFYILDAKKDIPTIDLICIAGYKYVSVNVNIAVSILLGWDLFYPVCAYTCTMIAIFTVKMLKRYTHHRTLADTIGTVSGQKTSFVFIIGAIQFPLVFLLSY